MTSQQPSRERVSYPQTSSTMTSATSWPQLRAQARSLESQTESLFQAYSAFTSNPPAKASEDELQTESKLQDLLARRETTVGSLARLLDSEAALTSSAAKLQNLTLHRQNLIDHRREFHRLKSSIAESRNRTNLLSTVRGDINAYRSASRLEEGQSTADYMLDERENIDRTHNIADSVLSQAYTIKDNFSDQRARLTQINMRIMRVAKQVPGINTLIGKINSRKRRDSIILAVLISFCFLMVLWLR
ncbi:hypothetical protein EDC01DRAFT_648871 [Geopyxis carbonaria]|nr:hypothetical protein EDC01DRAFT_648871 [Geopyxis carbonaria]